MWVGAWGLPRSPAEGQPSFGNVLRGVRAWLGAAALPAPPLRSVGEGDSARSGRCWLREENAGRSVPARARPSAALGTFRLSPACRRTASAVSVTLRL